MNECVRAEWKKENELRRIEMNGKRMEYGNKEENKRRIDSKSDV